MRKFIISLMVPALLIAGGCGSESSESGAEAPALESESVEQYALRGVVEAKDESANALTVRHEDVKDLMPGMTMSFRVEGAEVSALPAVGQGVEATLNVAGPDYWLTNVRAAAVPPSLVQTSTEGPASTTGGETAADPAATETQTGTATRE